MNFIESIESAASSIRESEGKRERIVRKLKELKGKNLKSGEMITEKAKPLELNERIAGVDSGFLGQELFAIDLMLLRAVGVVFEYKNEIMQKASYFPSEFEFPEAIISSEGLEREEFNCSVSIKRVIREMETARKVIEKFAPQYCFIDGSLLPQHADKPRGARIKSLYNEMLETVQELFETAESKNCLLIGCVEDSRGARWKEIILEEFLHKEKNEADLNGFFDSVLLDGVLEKGERTFCFPYTKNALEHPVLQDFREKWQNTIFAFYIKPSGFDFPLRVEFLNSRKEELKERVEKIAGIVLAQSSLNKQYAFPSVLIEADLRARLKSEEINSVRDRIIDKLGKNNLVLKRRERRPF